jgi:hypothetical protein
MQRFQSCLYSRFYVTGYRYAYIREYVCHYFIFDMSVATVGVEPGFL